MPGKAPSWCISLQNSPSSLNNIHRKDSYQLSAASFTMLRRPQNCTDSTESIKKSFCAVLSTLRPPSKAHRTAQIFTEGLKKHFLCCSVFLFVAEKKFFSARSAVSYHSFALKNSQPFSPALANFSKVNLPASFFPRRKKTILLPERDSSSKVPSSQILTSPLP